MRFSFQICPFPQFDLQVGAMPIIRLKNIGDICEVFAQVRYFVKTLVGEARLPSAVDMEKDRQVNPVLLEIEKKINIVVSGQVHLALQKIRQYWTSQEEIRYRREVLGMPDKYFHKMGTLQVALIGNSLHTEMYVLLCMNISLDKTMED